MGKLIDLKGYKQNKEVATELTRGNRQPLYVSHKTGKITGGEEQNEEFANRLQRIRASLERINKLMADLKSIQRGGPE